VPRAITACEGFRKTMQGSTAANVLHLEAPKPGNMPQPANDEKRNSVADVAAPAQTDEQLMLACKRGDSTAFSALFTRYKQPLFGFFRRRVSDFGFAEELTQETFIAVLRSLVRYQQTGLFRTYLYAIAHRILRSHRRKAFFRMSFSAAKQPLHEPASSVSLETDLLMRDALRKLDELDREILLLREFEQLAYAEIATVLDLPLNTVRSRLFRARSALHKILTASPVKSLATDLSITKEQA
jgi:RNA polymerase sigma-70 factor, ECF subfamily